MEKWRKVWREGIAPVLSDEALQSLLSGLLADDKTLIQGATTSPPPLQCVEDWDCEAACAIGYGGWKGEGLRTAHDVEVYFAKKCFESDGRMGEPGVIRWFLNWFDDTPRAEMRREFIPEITRELTQRKERKVEHV